MTGPMKNPRYEKFAQALAQGATSDAAYISAGFKANRGNATRLKAKESVQARVTELQARVADRVVETVADIARQLDEDREFARECAVPAAAVSATMGKAKVLGLIVDKTKVDMSGAIAITISSDDAKL